MNPFKQFVLAVFAVMSLSAGGAYAADPSLHEVYQQAEAGNYTQAHAMMDQVLHDHPNSGKAYFVLAELYAKEGKTDSARAELATAEQLAPGLPFAKPEAINKLRSRTHTSLPDVPVIQSVLPVQSGINWKMILVIALVVAAFVYFVRTLQRPQVTSSSPATYPAAGGGYAQPMGGGMGPSGPFGGSGMGSGILGSLATGAAVGAGMVAGEALMHRVLGGGQDSTAHFNDTAPVSLPDNNFDIGGSDFGISDGGSWDDSSASGGDDW